MLNAYQNLTKMTINEQIKCHLLAGKSITQLEALYQYGCMRLADQVYKLSNQGMKIDKVTVTKNGKHFAKYFIKF